MTKVGGKWAKQRDPNPETDCQLHSLSPTHSHSLSVHSVLTHTVTCSLAHLSSLRCCLPFPPPLTIFAIMRQFLFSVLFNVFFFALLSQLIALFIAFAFALFTLLKCAQLICLSVSSSFPLSLSVVYSPPLTQFTFISFCKPVK